jgi:polyphenol oxidase
MTFHETSRYILYFGSAHDNLSLDAQTREQIATNPFTIPPFQLLQKKMSLSDIVFLHQTHGTDGLIMQAKNDIPANNLMIEGDYIITNLSRVGIGIFTADCLPVICYDNKHHIAAIAHAGWKGALAGIIPTIVQSLQQQFKADLGDLTFFFGPSAQQCCYEVKQDFITLLNSYSFGYKTIHSTNNRLFFNLSLFVQLQLQHLGVPVHSCHMAYNTCTICNPHYFSYRRQQEHAGRQVTLIALK